MNVVLPNLPEDLFETDWEEFLKEGGRDLVDGEDNDLTEAQRKPSFRLNTNILVSHYRDQGLEVPEDLKKPTITDIIETAILVADKQRNDFTKRYITDKINLQNGQNPADYEDLLECHREFYFEFLFKNF